MGSFKWQLLSFPNAFQVVTSSCDDLFHLTMAKEHAIDESTICLAAATVVLYDGERTDREPIAVARTSKSTPVPAPHELRR
jgi:hypothetical protein